MTELKTLEDLKEEINKKIKEFKEQIKKGEFPKEKGEYSTNQISYDRLRQEAIKHYKKEVSVEIHDEPKSAFEWIEEFFSLTEEEKNE